MTWGNLLPPAFCFLTCKVRTLKSPSQNSCEVYTRKRRCALLETFSHLGEREYTNTMMQVRFMPAGTGTTRCVMGVKSRGRSGEGGGSWQDDLEGVEAWGQGPTRSVFRQNPKMDVTHGLAFSRCRDSFNNLNSRAAPPSSIRPFAHASPSA